MAKHIHSILLHTVHAWSPLDPVNSLWQNTFIPSSCIHALAPHEQVDSLWRDTFVPSSFIHACARHLWRNIFIPFSRLRTYISSSWARSFIPSYGIHSVPPLEYINEQFIPYDETHSFPPTNTFIPSEETHLSTLFLAKASSLFPPPPPPTLLNPPPLSRSSIALPIGCCWFGLQKTSYKSLLNKYKLWPKKNCCFWCRSGFDFQEMVADMGFKKN